MWYIWANMSMPHELYKTTRLGNDSKYTIGPYIYSIHDKLQYFFFRANPCRSTPCIFQVAHSSPRIPFGSAAAAGWWCPIDKGTTWLGHNSFWRSGRRKSSYFACRVSAISLCARKKIATSSFFRICWASSTLLHLRFSSNFSPFRVVYYIHIYTMTPPLLHILTEGKYAILYYTLVHVCELLKGTHHNTLGLRNHVGCQGKEFTQIRKKVYLIWRDKALFLIV